MDASWIIDQLAKEWGVIKAAPVSFGLALVLVSVLIYLLFRHWYKDTLERKDTVIASLEKVISTKPLLPTESTALDQERKQKLENWRRLLYDVEKKYKSGKFGDDFVEILQRQEDYKSLGPYLSVGVKARLESTKDSMQKITFDVSRNREGHRELTSLISEDIARIAQTWNLV
jgi:hypothetical protein